MKNEKSISKILGLKEMTKDQLELEVKRVRNELDDEQARLEHLRNTLEYAKIEFENRRSSDPLHRQELEVFYAYVASVSSQIKRQRTLVHEKQAAFDAAQHAMLEAYKEKKLVEILYHRVLHEEMRETLLSEQKEADFSFLSRKARL